MSSMFNNFVGKGFRKFANIFFKNNVTTIDLSKDHTGNILNNINKDALDDYGQGKIPNKDITGRVDKIMPVFWEEKEKVDKEDIDNRLATATRVYNNLDLRLQTLPNRNLKNNILEENKSVDEELIRNRVKNRVCKACISANTPREDRSNAIQLKNFDGYFLSVLDGHGGEDVAEYANKELHKRFDQRLLELKDEGMKEKDKVKSSIEFAFEQIEKEFYDKALEKYNQGDAKLAYIGSCALCVVVHDNMLYVANLGDCKARLFRKNFIKENITNYIPIKISITHNAGKFYEQKRLREKFKDLDIVVEKGYACYVKGRLQPTKSLGDLYMKHKEFNQRNPKLKEKYQKKIIEHFNGPYIEHLPDVQLFELTHEDEFLVLATDGLWDWLDSKDVADIINTYKDDKSKIADALWREALSKAAERANLKIDQVLELPKSMKRTVHDDISILVVDLKNQVSYKSKNKK